MASRISDDPVAANELDCLVAFVGNADGVVKKPVHLKRLRLLGCVLRLNLHSDVVRHGFGCRRAERLAFGFGHVTIL